MLLFAEMVLFPDGIIIWVVIGLVAGFLAGRTLQPSQLGIVGDAGAGITGALAGGLTIFLLVAGTTGFLIALAVAAVVAFTFIGILRKVMASGD